MKRYNACWAQRQLEQKRRDGWTLLTLCSEEKILGLIAVQACTGEIAALYAHPEEWGRGYGSVLLREALRRVNPGMQPLSTNQRACGLCERRGFIWTGEALSLSEKTQLKELTYRYKGEKAR